MKRTFTFLMTALFLCVGMVKAAVTDVPEMSTEGNIKWYTIKNVRKQKFATYAGDDATMTQNKSASAASFFYFTASTTEGAVKIHNFAAGENLCAAYNSWTATGIDWYLKAQETGVSICTSTGEWDAWNDAGGGGQKIEYWSASDAGSAWEISLVTDFSSIINVPAAKDAAKTELDNLAKISALFSDATQAKADVDAVEAAGTGLTELNAAVEAINAVVLAYKKQINGKNVRFTTYGRNTTDGHDLTAVAAGGTGTTNSADAGIWTLTSNEDGTFKMYNFVSNLYLGGTKGQSQRVPTCESFADAASYTFNVKEENEENIVNLLNNGNTLHVDGSANIVQWNDNSADASIWKVVSCDPIVVTREQYDAATAAKASLPYAIQQAYGLVADATNYYSNYKSEAEGSYDALLDNQESSYFHSAYGEETGDGSGVHYIQADLGEGNSVDEFYFYMVPRSGNGNNRPKDITVSGSNDLNVGFTEIAKVTTTLDGSMTPYVSGKLGAEGTNYRYIRLTVTSTNTGTKFFTLSELYFLPAEADVTSLIDSYKAFASSSITSESMATAATALINAETILTLSNIKKEVAALLATNESNHAATPALGQYATEAYDALNAAYTAADATQESLEAAIAAFKATKNLPVFTITGVKDYVVGKSIYDNNSGTLYFKATNLYDKSMWWAFDQTATTVGVTEEVAVTNVATGNGFWGAEAIKVTETDPGITDDNIFLFYTKGNGTPIHFQKDNQQIVRWNSTDAGSGSATIFNYIGNTYDLGKLTDEHIAALAKLQATCDANEGLKDVTFGTELGQYSGSKDDLVAALDAAKEILAEDVVGLANMEVSAIEAAEAAVVAGAAKITFNVPVDGKYYRIMAVSGWNDDARYLGSKNSTAKDGRAEFVADADANTIFLFKDGYLKNYATGLYLVNNSGFLGYNGEQAVGSKIDFHAASNGLSGAYNISFNDGNRWLYCNKNKYTDAGGRGTENGYCFNLVEVTELPVLNVALDRATAELTAADATVTLVATVTPDVATNKAVTWTSSDEAVATVVDGVVTAVANGKATITAKAGEKTATCEVTVAIEEPETPETPETPEEPETPATTLSVVRAMVGDVEIVEGAATVESISSFEITFDRPVALAEDAEWAQLTDKWGDNPLKAEVLEENNCVVRFSLQWDVFTDAGDYYLYIPEAVVVGAEDANYANAEIQAVITIEGGSDTPAASLNVTNVTVGEDVMEGFTVVATTRDMIKVNFDGMFYYNGDPTIVDADGNDASAAFEFGNDYETGTSYYFKGMKAGVYTITLAKASFMEMMSYKAPAEDIVLTVQIVEAPATTLSVVRAMVGDVEIVEGAATVESISSFEITFDRPVALAEDAEWAQLTDKWGDNPLKAEVLEENNCVVRFSLQWDVFTDAGDYYLYIPEAVVVGAEDANYANAAIEAVITIEGGSDTPAAVLTVLNVTVGEDVMEGFTVVATTEDTIKVNFDGMFWYQGDPTIVDAEGNDASDAFMFASGLDFDGSNSYIFMGQKEGIYTITLAKDAFLEYLPMYMAPAEDIVLTVQITLPEGIEKIKVDADAVIYDIHGRRVSTMEKGIYIVNGRKVIVK